MLKLYKEHPEFDEFTKFDTKAGKLVAITEEEFNGFLPADFEEKPTDEGKGGRSDPRPPW